VKSSLRPVSRRLRSIGRSLEVVTAGGEPAEGGVEVEAFDKVLGV
jgi:hypothetical protein